jgi:hypothetical protein
MMIQGNGNVMLRRTRDAVLTFSGKDEEFL